MFLLVPAQPGCPGQFPQSRKTVVCVCVCITCLSFGAHHKNLNADRPILSAAENVVSSDIRVMQIYAGVREIWGVKQESGRLRCRFS